MLWRANYIWILNEKYHTLKISFGSVYSYTIKYMSVSEGQGTRNKMIRLASYSILSHPSMALALTITFAAQVLMQAMDILKQGAHVWNNCWNVC